MCRDKDAYDLGYERKGHMNLYSLFQLCRNKENAIKQTLLHFLTTITEIMIQIQVSYLSHEKCFSSKTA
jgi:hypothetical protein